MTCAAPPLNINYQKQLTMKRFMMALSAALMLTNMISPISAFAEDVSEPMTDAYMDAPADDAPEETPETEPPYYSITLPW